MDKSDIESQCSSQLVKRNRALGSAAQIQDTNFTGTETRPGLSVADRIVLCRKDRLNNPDPSARSVSLGRPGGLDYVNRHLCSPHLSRCPKFLRSLSDIYPPRYPTWITISAEV
jgi:hypothetical protein